MYKKFQYVYKDHMASKASFLGYKLPIYVIDPTLIPDESMEQDLIFKIKFD